MTEPTAPAIHKAIRDAMRDIASVGIAKTQQASLGGGTVNYRGIEAAMNQMCAVLIRHSITVTPRYSALQITERIKGDPKDGKATRFAVVLGTFEFAAVADGSCVRCEHYGEAMDSGDKAVTKAQSVAFRTALFQQFVIPTMAIDPESDDDGDGDGNGNGNGNGNGGAKAISPEVYNATLKALQGADALETLRKLAEDASQMAQAADDQHAKQEFREATKKRKTELVKATAEAKP